MTGDIRVGTSGWSFDSWIGTFYPEGSPHRDLLKLYCQSFDTVEINNTFYALPTRAAATRWRRTPNKGFKFAVKASRYLTHRKKLKDPRDGLNRFFFAIEPLGGCMGPILFQLPPRWQVDKERLQAFLQILPGDYRYAFEFRDHSWLNEEIYELLAKYGVSLCFYDLKGYQSPEVHTAGFSYVRLHGPQEAYGGSYDDQTLQSYADKILRWADEGRDVYCYFDNDQKSHAPLNASSLLHKIDLLKRVRDTHRDRA